MGDLVGQYTMNGILHWALRFFSLEVFTTESLFLPVVSTAKTFKLHAFEIKEMYGFNIIVFLCNSLYNFCGDLDKNFVWQTFTLASASGGFGLWLSILNRFTVESK